MPANRAIDFHDSSTPQQDASALAGSPVEALLVPAAVAGRLCGRSKASWWRDHAAGRVPAPVKLAGSTLWRVEELRRWVAGGCPSRAIWEAMEKSRRK